MPYRRVSTHLDGLRVHASGSIVRPGPMAIALDGVGGQGPSRNPQGSAINYYGRFYKSMLYPALRHFNDTLVRWAMRKYKRLRRRRSRAGSSLISPDASRSCLRTGAGAAP
jgi:hypothetical protein